MEQGESDRALVVGGDSPSLRPRGHCRKLGMAVDVSSRRPDAERAPNTFFSIWVIPTLRAAHGNYHYAFVCAAVASMQACGRALSSRGINVANTLG